MVKRGIIVATDSNMATIEEIKDVYCFDCIKAGKHNNCLKCKKRSPDNVERHISTNHIGAEIGDIVEYSKNTLANLLVTLLCLILPILCAFVSYAIINFFTSNDPLSIKIAFSILAVSMICAGLYSYKLSKCRCDYKIISRI